MANKSWIIITNHQWQVILVASALWSFGRVAVPMLSLVPIAHGLHVVPPDAKSVRNQGCFTEKLGWLRCERVDEITTEKCVLNYVSYFQVSSDYGIESWKSCQVPAIPFTKPCVFYILDLLTTVTHAFKSVSALQDADAPRKTSSAQQPWRWWPNDMFIDGASIQEFVETALEILFTLPNNLNLAPGPQVCQIVGVCWPKPHIIFQSVWFTGFSLKGQNMDMGKLRVRVSWNLLHGRLPS